MERKLALRKHAGKDGVVTICPSFVGILSFSNESSRQAHAFEFDPIADLLPHGPLPVPAPIFRSGRVKMHGHAEWPVFQRSTYVSIAQCVGNRRHNGRKILMNSKPTILVIASRVDSFTLKDGRKEHTGYYLNELDVPVQAALDAGYQMVLATPEGNKPVMDPRSPVAAHFGAVKWPSERHSTSSTPTPRCRTRVHSAR